MAGAAAGTVIGGVGGEIIKGVGSKLGKDAASDLTGTVLGGYIGEKTGNAVKDELDKGIKPMLKNNLFNVVKLILCCLILFFIGDVIAELLASSDFIILKRDFSPLVGVMFFDLSLSLDMSAASFWALGFG